VAEAVDRRVVASPAQVVDLLSAVQAQGRRGQHLYAFFAVLYYGGLRPSEAVALRESGCILPGSGWGRLDLADTEPRAGRNWTDHGGARDQRGLKHRSADDVREVPIPPVLVSILRDHLEAFGAGPDGRVYRSSNEGPLQETAYGKVWREARKAVLTPGQVASPLARRPYDLRHARAS
jgi:integrase